MGMLKSLARSSVRSEHGEKPMIDESRAPMRYARPRTVGAAMYLFVAAAACLAVVSIGMAARDHAPTWAIFLSVCILAISVPLGAVVSYVFFVVKDDGEESSSRRA
jgi:hypothetical protein